MRDLFNYAIILHSAHNYYNVNNSVPYIFSLYLVKH